MHPPRLEVVKKDRPKPTSVAPASKQRAARRRFLITGRASLVPAVLAAALALMAKAPARGADGSEADFLAGLLARNKPVICRDQTYALCTGVSCFVFNNVAYCGCDVRKGDSISTPFTYDNGNGNVCSLNADGADNGYMVSTFSPPESIIAPSGNQALYACPRTSSAAYARCDGGICFTSTIGHTAPGSDTPLSNNQIVCSCPIDRANPIQGLEIIGPYPCQESFFENCDSAVATGDTGSSLSEGTSIGATVRGTRLLTGSVPPLNTCR